MFVDRLSVCVRFLTQYKCVYERDVKCQVKMSHNSGSLAPAPPSPDKDEVPFIIQSGGGGKKNDEIGLVSFTFVWTNTMVTTKRTRQS